MKRNILVFCIFLILGIVSVSGCTSSSPTYSSYNSSVMNFEYPSDWNTTSKTNMSVDVRKDADNWVQVLVLKNFAKFVDEGNSLSDLGFEDKGYYTENTTKTQYQVFTKVVNGQDITVYLFAKNGTHYELRGTADLDVFDKIVATIN